MFFREATIADISEIQFVRRAVRENVLSNHGLVTDHHCIDYITNRGKGWVCEAAHQIVGFSIVDLKENNVWALFVLPQYENKGVGRQLHQLMLDWYFNQTKANIWLGTAFNTRAEQFYRKQGWIETGLHGSNEIKFEMTYENWQKKRRVYTEQNP